MRAGLGYFEEAGMGERRPERRKDRTRVRPFQDFSLTGKALDYRFVMVVSGTSISP